MIENTRLTALVASRICHDMVEPMSAIIQGLEMIKGADGKTDPDALSLLDHGVGKAWAKLEFFRFAMAGAIAEGESTIDEGREVAIKLYSVLKAELKWDVPPIAMPRPAVRVIVNLLLIANECLPRGGTVEVTGKAGEVRIIATGPRAKLREPTATALKGDGGDEHLSGHTIQPTLTGLLARQGGVELSAIEAEERIELIARSEAFKI
ncbi:signal transduction histidine kinase [alpha proteobacterium U9-1i]|nr:signal transduction histidine kinase [alpha proteobacterium U9-1i]